MSITRSDMRTRVQRRIGDSSGNFYGTALYNDIIETRAITCGGVIARLRPNYYITHTNYTGVDDAVDSAYEFYRFPTDFRSFIQLERILGSGAGSVYQPLRTVNSEDQDRYRLYNVALLTLPDSITNYEQTVSIWDSRFRVIPAPANNSYEFRLKYIRRPIALSSDETTLDIPDEWIEVVALDCAYFVLSQLGDTESAAMLRENLDREYKMMRDE